MGEIDVLQFSAIESMKRAHHELESFVRSLGLF